MRRIYITPSIKVAEAKFHESLMLIISVDNSTAINPKEGVFAKGDNSGFVEEEW